MAALLARNHRVECAVVLPFGFASSLLTQLPATGNPSSALSATAGNPPSGLDSPLSSELPRFGRNDGRARGRGRVLRSFAKRTHSTIHRWVLSDAPELDKRVRPHLNLTNDSWRVDETYIEVKGKWKYLYRAVDSMGNTLDFMLSAKRDGKAAARFFHKVLKATHTQTPRVSRYASCEALTVDKNAAYPVAIEALKADETLAAETE